MIRHSAEAGTTLRKAVNGAFGEADATIEITVSDAITPGELIRLLSAMSRLHKNFLGAPLDVEKIKLNFKKNLAARNKLEAC